MSPQGQQSLRHIPPDISAVSSPTSHRPSALSHPSTAEDIGETFPFHVPTFAVLESSLAVNVYCVVSTLRRGAVSDASNIHKVGKHMFPVSVHHV